MKTFLSLFWITILSLLLLSGCSSMSPLTITTELLDSAGNVVSKTTDTVADASVAKEKIIHKTLQTDTAGYYAALEKSGAVFEVTGYQEIALADGSKGYLPMTKTSFKEAPNRNTTLPTSPSIHPGWHFAEKVSGDLLTFGLADLTAGVLDTAFDSAQTKYYGNYNPQTAAPYIVEPTVITSP
jgi:uncharacterized protein YceK